MLIGGGLFLSLEGPIRGAGGKIIEVRRVFGVDDGGVRGGDSGSVTHNEGG
jgi:hypothetical protein